MIAWLAGIMGAYVSAQWGLMASPERVVFLTAMCSAIFTLLNIAFLLHSELVVRPAMAQQGHVWAASREASVTCIVMLSVALFFLVKAALVSRRSVSSWLPNAWRTVHRCFLGALITSGATLACVCFVEGEVVVVTFLTAFVPGLLLARYTLSAFPVPAEE